VPRLVRITQNALPTQTEHNWAIDYALGLWQFFDDSLSVFLIYTSIYTRAFRRRRYLKGSAGEREACAGVRVMHYD